MPDHPSFDSSQMQEMQENARPQSDFISNMWYILRGRRYANECLGNAHVDLWRECGAERPSRPVPSVAAVAASATGAAAAPAPLATSPSSEKMTQRYTDGYRVASALVGIGTVLKAIGIIGGVLIALIAVGTMSR